MFTRSLWSCLQNLVGFGPRLIIRSSISQTENRAVFLGQNFSLSPVEPAFANDQPVIRVFSAWQGFLRVHWLISWIFTFHCVGSTGANVFAYTGALSFCLLIVGSTGALWVRLCVSLDNCTDVGLDFVGSSGVTTPVELTLFKPIRRINRCLSFSCYRLCIIG